MRILFGFTYFFLVTGFSVSAHYCNGNLESIQIFQSSPNCCCIGEDGKAKDCCNSLTEIIQVEEEHINAPGVEFELQELIVIQSNTTVIPSFQFNAQTEEVLFYADLPSPPNQRPLYLIYSSYTFYG